MELRPVLMLKRKPGFDIVTHISMYIEKRPLCILSTRVGVPSSPIFEDAMASISKLLNQIADELSASTNYITGALRPSQQHVPKMTRPTPNSRASTPTKQHQRTNRDGSFDVDQCRVFDICPGADNFKKKMLIILF
jgi:hypothetical protein